jgi:hypothetical protein
MAQLSLDIKILDSKFDVKYLDVKLNISGVFSLGDRAWLLPFVTS